VKSLIIARHGKLTNRYDLMRQYMYDGYDRTLRFNVQRDVWRTARTDWCEENIPPNGWNFDIELDVLTIVDEAYFFWFENTFSNDTRLMVKVVR